MPGTGFGLFVVALVASIALGVLLYSLVRSEQADRTITSREEAERLARRDTDGEK